MTSSDETETLDDLQLLALSRKGDRHAFGQLVSRHRRSCLNLATLILRNRAEAEDEVQKALWKAFERLDQFLGDGDFCAWLLRIVINECRMLLRIRKRARFLYLDGGHKAFDGKSITLLSPAADPEHELVRREMSDVLQAEILRIPPLFRKVILLRDIQGLSMPQVADHLGITIPAAKSRLLRARSELRGRVERRCGTAKHILPLSSKQTLPARSGHQHASLPV
jgi:RNA polymerase sigma-70 factor (ECF subfamily)